MRILEGYGLTEATCVSSCNPPGGERRIGSIGLRLPWQLDEDRGAGRAGGASVRDCAADEVGAIRHLGPNVFEGYLCQEHNREIWIDCGDGQTGSTPAISAAQTPTAISGRPAARRKSSSGAATTSTRRRSRSPSRPPDVLLAAAVGRPDAHAGDLPVAYVQLKPGATATEADLSSLRVRRSANGPRCPRISASSTRSLSRPSEDLQTRFETTAKSRPPSSRRWRGGIAATRVTVARPPRAGLLATVELAKPEDEGCTARTALGAFPYPFAFRTEG